MGLQNTIWANRSKTTFLLLLFPIFFFGIIFIIMFFGSVNLGVDFALENALYETISIIGILGPIILIRGIISFFFYRQIVFKFSGAKPISRKSHPQIYNIVENLCISRGLATPNIGIIDDESYNAFAIGWKPKNSWIVFSKGILEKLEKNEIEAVAAHELTHIINKDSLLSTWIIIFIGAVATIGEILIRSAGRIKSDKKDSGQAQMVIFLVGLALIVLGYLIFPIVRLAISRKREYLADAGSVELTKSPDSMISALQKISSDPIIETIRKGTVAAMCIENPFDKKKKGLGSFFQNLLSTHPSIEDRINVLKQV